MKTRRDFLAATSISVVGIALPFGAQAQAPYPSRSMKMIVPWPAGQATDLVGRVIAQELSKTFDQPVVVDNKPGAGGMIGTDAAAKSPPDGYTLLAASSGPVSISPLLIKTPYEVERDLMPVAMVGTSPYVLVAAPSFSARDIREFIALVRTSPGKYSFASSGTAATGHLLTEAFNTAAGLSAVHVPYKGSTPALTDVMGGQVTYCMETAAATMPFVRSGQLKAYGVSMEKGSAVTPGITPIATVAGLAGFDLGAWIGVMVPAGTPSQVVERLSAAVQGAMLSEPVKQAFASISVELDYRSAEDYSKYLKVISARFDEVIKSHHIRI